MDSNLISKLESQGNWESALALAKESLKEENNSTSTHYHIIGRLYQRLGKLKAAKRSYKKALAIDKNLPRTLNNLILLDLHLFNIQEANKWLKFALAVEPLSDDEKELIYTSACDLKLFELKHLKALEYIEKQIEIKHSLAAWCNKSICLQKLNKISEAIQAQLIAIKIHLDQHGIAYNINNLDQFVRVNSGDIEDSTKLQTTLMNLGVLILTQDNYSNYGIKLIMAGMANERNYWLNPIKSKSIWNGEYTKKLILWDDQGYGDTLQNLAWISSAAKRSESLEIWLRPSLIKLIEERLDLPSNCILRTLNKSDITWPEESQQLGLFFLPFILKEWNKNNLKSYSGVFRKNPQIKQKEVFKIGIVWSAGKHSSPQPERNARIRDLPFNLLWDISFSWRRECNLELISLQLNGHHDQFVTSQINDGLLSQGLKSNDWLATANILESLDLLISVDTSVAHLAGALGVKCIMLVNCPSDWRWGQQGNETSIYKSLTLLRCNAPNKWTEALNQLDHLVRTMIIKKFKI